MSEDTKLPVAKFKPWPKDEWYKVEYELPRVEHGHHSGEVVVLLVDEYDHYTVSADVYDHALKEWGRWNNYYKVVAWRALPWPPVPEDMLTVEWLDTFEGRSDAL
jgi:hypothetical protein